MASHDVKQQFGVESFSCPHCNVVAHQDWFSLFLKPENANDLDALTPETVTVRTLVQGKNEWNDIKEIDEFVERLKKNEVTYVFQKHSQSVKAKMANLHVSGCHSCNGFALWVSGRLLFPIRLEKTPELVEEDFADAAAILNKFPREATALMRVCIQKLVPLLKKDGSYLNDYMSSVVRKGLEVEIQQSMEVLQVLRNESGQPTNLETQEDKEMALRFFDSLKAVLERRMLRNGEQN
jgi:hypothetical protein